MSEEITKYEAAPVDFSLTVHRAPEDVIAEAQKAATALQRIVAQKKRPVIINGEQYLEFEDWMTVARFYGVTARIRETRYIQYGDAVGFEAIADALLVKTGEVISSAESMCLNDEAKWKGRELFQIRSMAQTRAAAKALRNVFAWVVVLAGYRPSVAEEMTGTEGGNGKQPLEKPQAKAPVPAGNGKELTVREKLTLELAQYCPDPAKRSAVLKELSSFKTKEGLGNDRWLLLKDLSDPKTSEKWIQATLGKLRKRAEDEKQKAAAANVPAWQPPKNCPKAPQDCDHSKFGSDGAVYCQDDKTPCPFIPAGGDDFPF